MLQWIQTRSRRDLVLACVVACGFFLFGGVFLFSRGADRVRHVVEHEARHVIEHEARAEYSSHGGVAFDQSFDVGNLGRLEVHLADVDVAVSDGSGEARVVLRVDDEDVSAEFLEDLGFEVEASNGSLTIRTEDGDWNWGDADDYDLSLEITVPSDFDIYVQTGDGDVAVGSFEGEVNVQTGDGDVAVGWSEGPVLRVQTGDGDIAIGGATSRTVHLQTGDGDIAAASMAADEVTVRTGDGDINIHDLSGALEASTGDGDVQVHVTRFDGIEIRSGDGDITVYVPTGISADVKLTGSDFMIDDAFALPVRMSARTVEGLLNGGGPELSIRVGDGTIRIRER